MRKHFIIFGIVLLSGCSTMWVAWIGYKKPISDSFRSVPESGSGCAQIGVQNLSEEQQNAVLGAAKEICRIFHSDSFAREVTAHNWLASCDGDADRPVAIAGTEVLRRLTGSIPRFSVHPRQPMGALAQTDPDSADARIAIPAKRIAYWSSSDRQLTAEFINTLAHEMTHVISLEFADAGHGTANCPDEQLVSYGIGNLTEAMWLRSSP